MFGTAPNADSAIPFLASDGELESLEDFAEPEDNLTPGSEILSVFRPGIVHRLDIGTSGLLVVALNEHSLRHLSKQFEERTVSSFPHYSYLASEVTFSSQCGASILLSY